MSYKHLRVEETPPPDPNAETDKEAPKIVARMRIQTGPFVQSGPQTIDEWRRNAINTAERLSIAEATLNDIRQAADENRARATKYKLRLDNANKQINKLQTELVRVTAERDEVRDKLIRQDEVRRLIHQYRESLLTGPIWELFAEFCPATTGREEKS